MNLSPQNRETLIRALEDFDSDREHFARRDDGSLWTFVVSEATDEIRERREAILGAESEKWARVPSRSSRDAFEEIEDFVELLEDVETRNTLFATLEGRGAFRAFREFMLDHPSERASWEEFRAERSARRLAHFLESLVGSAMETRIGTSQSP